MSKVSINQLASYAADRIGSGSKVEDVANSLASFLLAERRSRESSLLFRAIEKELDKRGSTQVSIVSAYKIDQATKKQLAKLLNVENPVFNETIDKSVIGGVKASAKEQEVDLTVEGRLNRFKQQVINSSN